MSQRLGLLILVLSLAVVAPSNATPPAPQRDRGHALGTSPGPQAVYVSTSGIAHGDIANVKRLRAGRGWDPGDPNSINADWRSALDTVWDQIAGEDADGVLATGDMVQGYWGIDLDHTGIFGPVDTFAHKKAAVVNAGKAYEGHLRREWSAHGLTVYPGMGDHEIGDLNNAGHTSAQAFKSKALGSWLHVWEGTMGRPSYYHVRIPGSVELWTLQPFHKTDQGVDAEIGPTQMRWLRRSLGRSTATWKVVQTEIPPYGGENSDHSSRTTLHNADALYGVLARAGVDLVLSAEFHEVNAVQKRGIPEIIHGGRMQSGTVNYLVLGVYADRLDITLKRMARATMDGSQRLWAPGGQRPPLHIQMSSGATVAGHMTVTHQGVTEATGDLVLQ